MSHIDNELDYLREMSIEMLELVKSQLEKSKTALIDFNIDLAEEIVRTELRVNALELNIDKECENIIALHQPVATDLRFILATLKSVSDIERIGDHADGIAKSIIDRKDPYKLELLKAIRIESMFDFTIEMFDDIITSLTNKDTEIARKVFKKDKELNEHFRSSKKIIGEELTRVPDSGITLLALFSVIAKLERTGDLLTNVGEEIIFYIDAEILKHKKKNKKIRKEINEQ